MALKRMDNVGIVVDDLAAAIDFFRELGLELEGRATIERLRKHGAQLVGEVTSLPAAVETRESFEEPHATARPVQPEYGKS
jgi:catechol 2,3-dioxygenase-like lactoylglutathione lyase family enzyme